MKILQKAIEKLQMVQTSKSLKFRQKIIQLADQSEFSWDAAEEYGWMSWQG